MATGNFERGFAEMFGEPFAQARWIDGRCNVCGWEGRVCDPDKDEETFCPICLGEIVGYDVAENRMIRAAIRGVLSPRGDLPNRADMEILVGQAIEDVERKFAQESVSYYRAELRDLSPDERAYASKRLDEAIPKANAVGEAA